MNEKDEDTGQVSLKRVSDEREEQVFSKKARIMREEGACEKSIGKKFKSPEMKKPSGDKKADVDDEEPEKVVSRLEEQIADLDAEIRQLRDMERLDVAELDIIINKLHMYNDVKDTAQFLLEKMANIKCVTIKKMHQIYNLNYEID